MRLGEYHGDCYRTKGAFADIASSQPSFSLFLFFSLTIPLSSSYFQFICPSCCHFSSFLYVLTLLYVFPTCPPIAAAITTAAAAAAAAATLFQIKYLPSKHLFNLENPSILLQSIPTALFRNFFLMNRQLTILLF